MRKLKLGVLFALATAAPVAAQADRFQPMDVFNLEYVAQTAISPDGQWVVYVRQFFDVMTDRRYSNLWLVRSDGTDSVPCHSFSNRRILVGMPRILSAE